MADETALLGKLAEDFTARVRKGETPEVESYARSHPELAERIRDLFPTLMLLEGLAGNASGPAAPEDARAELRPGGIFRHYRILREIGRGGMGIVYEAVHLALEKRVALKVLPVGGPRQASQLERFLREAKTAAGLHHTNIVPVFDVGQGGGIPYFAMQYIDGRGLDAILAELASGVFHPGGRAASSAGISAETAFEGLRPGEGTLELIPGGADLPAAAPPLEPAALPGGSSAARQRYRWIADLGIQASEGLAHAHARGVVHRDIKPSNLILDEQGRLWIADFGLARRLDDVTLTHSGAVLGTPRYMSPEQAEASSRQVDHRTDIYSLGATLYELLARRPAFGGSTPQEVVQQILARDPVPPRRLDRSVPRDLETIVLKAMSRRPQDRYPTADALRDDLGRFLRLEPIRARRIGPIGRVSRWCRRRPAMAAMTGLVLLASAAGVSGVTWQWRMAERARADEATAKTQAQEARKAAELALARSEEQLYLNRIALAERYWSANDVARAEEVLDECPASLRHWEWGYLKRLFHSETRSFPGYEALYTPDGLSLLALTPAGVVVHDLREGGSASVPGPAGSFNCMGISPDGARLVLGGRDKKVLVWDVAARRELLALAGHQGAIRCVLFTGDGSRIVSASDRTGSHGGGEIELHRPGELKVWDAMSGKEILGIRWAGNSAAVSPDGKHLVSLQESFLGGIDLKVWSAATGNVLHDLGDLSYPSAAIQFSPDGTLLAHTDGDLILLRGTGDYQVSRTLRGHGDKVVDLAFSSDGKRLASAGFDETVRVWDPGSGEELALFRGHRGTAGRVVFRPRSAQLASVGADGLVRIWDSDKPQGVRGIDADFEGGVATLAFSSDGTLLALAGREEMGLRRLFSRRSPRGEVRSVETGAKVATLSLNTGKALSERLFDYELAFASTGKLATGNPDGTIQIWDGSSGKEERSFGDHAGAIVGLSFSPDGRSIAALDQGLLERGFHQGGIHISNIKEAGALKVWDVETGREVLRIPEEMVRADDVAYSPDGGSLAVAVPRQGKGYIVELRDARTGALLRDLKGHGRRVTSVAFAPGGGMLASASWDETVRVWDVAGGKEVHCLRGHKSYVYDVSFSPDGKRLASAGDSVRIWNPLTGEEVLRLPQFAQRVAFSPDGKRLAAQAYRVLLWDGSPPSSRKDAVPSVPPGDAERWNVESWEVVRQPGLAAEAYGRALAGAERAVEAYPDNADYLNTLGAALFRAGRLERALEVLRRSDATSSGFKQGMNFEDTAFLAMTLQGLGRGEEASAALEKLRGQVKTLESLHVFEIQEAAREARAFLGEAEMAIGGARKEASSPVEAPPR